MPGLHSELPVTRLYHRGCDTTIQDRFLGDPFAQLSPEKIEFEEIFIRNEGKITRIETDLGLSYPTIRNRLHEVIRALGYEPGKEESRQVADDECRKILGELNQGKLTSEDALQL